MRLVTVCIGSFLLLAGHAASARAEPPSCMKLSREQSRMIADTGASKCGVGCEGCGCKGGPGYRAPPTEIGKKGPCVGYRDLYSRCGPPPHAGCTFECTPVAEGCVRPEIPVQAAADKHADAKRMRKRTPASLAPVTLLPNLATVSSERAR
jgi:hypothetical protein